MVSMTIPDQRSDLTGLWWSLAGAVSRVSPPWSSRSAVEDIFCRLGCPRELLEAESPCLMYVRDSISGLSVLKSLEFSSQLGITSSIWHDEFVFKG